MDPKTNKLKKLLANISPEHDTAVGLVHPYWARKPLNIVESVIRAYSSEGDLVVDPFMGSGTTLYAALKNSRTAVGGDINPLSVFLVRAILEIARNGELIIPEIERLLNLHAEKSLPWFEVDERLYIERQRYDVKGVFADGKFSLTTTEIVTKQKIHGKWSMRKARVISDDHLTRQTHDKFYDKFKNSPINFSELDLIPNSRIAIPTGANLSHYFTEENQASINLLISLIRKSPLYKKYPEALMLIVSSSLPLLRLSDKKASSQWPYWRPKQHLTSRNPVMVLEDRLDAIKKLRLWSRQNLSYLKDEELLPNARLNVFNSSAQELSAKMGSLRADLIFTDPPYGDQVPYIEYSSLWNGILGLKVKRSTFKQEVVKTDAQTRKSDSADYHNRLRKSFQSNAALLKESGYLIWFYQDQDLSCWATINSAAKSEGLSFVDVIPLPKQRRSLKTVTSPNTTLDGDLLCIFRKTPDDMEYQSKCKPPEELRDILHRSSGTYFDNYAILIDYALKYDLINLMATEYKTVKNALSKIML